MQWVTCMSDFLSILKRYHSGMRRRIQVSHPNLFNFVTLNIRISVGKTADLQRLKRDIRIRRPKKKRNFRMASASRHASRSMMPENTLNYSFCAP